MKEIGDLNYLQYAKNVLQCYLTVMHYPVRIYVQNVIQHSKVQILPPKSNPRFLKVQIYLQVQT